MKTIMTAPETTTKKTPGSKSRKGTGIGMSLPWAEFISFWANWVLVGALIVGVVATWAIVVTGNVKETASNERIAEANARAAEANEKAKEAELAFAIFKAPRTMTEADARQFIEEASKYSGTHADIWIIGDNPEPIGIGQIIFRLLEIGGWKTAPWN